MTEIVTDHGDGRVTVKVGMEYPGGGVSKNRLFIAGNRRNGMTPLAASWKATLAESVRMALIGAGNVTPALPVVIAVRCHFRNKNEATDPHNLNELICDAIEEATGINDRDYTITTYAPSYGPGLPFIMVALTVNRAVPQPVKLPPVKALPQPRQKKATPAAGNGGRTERGPMTATRTIAGTERGGDTPTPPKRERRRKYSSDDAAEKVS